MFTNGLQLENYSTPEEQMWEERHKRRVSRKYNTPAFDMETLDYVPSKPVTLDDINKEEFKTKRKNFEQGHELFYDVKGFENWGLAWDMNDAKDANLKDYGAFARGELSLDEIKQREYRRKQDIAAKRGLLVSDIDRWENRKYQGLIWGLSDTLNDVRDSLVKSGALAAGFTTVGAATGALIGFFAGEGIGAIPGAQYGAELGLTASRAVAFDAGIFWDTAEKESAIFLKNYLEAKPNATPQEIEEAKKHAAVNGLIDGALEAGAAHYFAGQGAKIAARIPGLQKIVPESFAQLEQSAIKPLKSLLSKEAGKDFVLNIGKNIGAEFTQEEVQNALDHASEYRLNVMDKKFTTVQGWLAEAGETLGLVAQKTALLAGFGASVDLHTRIRHTANTLNTKIEQNNLQYEEPIAITTPEGQQRVFELGVAKTEEIQTAVAQMPDTEIKKVETQKQLQVQELDSKISNVQSRINSAENLGLSSQEVSGLQNELNQLEEQRIVATSEYRMIGTERAIKQASEQIDAELANTDTEIQNVSNSISEVETQIAAAQEKGKSAEKLIVKKTKLEDKISALEDTRDQLSADKIKLQERQDILPILKGRKITVPAEVLVGMEERAIKEKETVKQKSEMQINKIREKQTKDKIRTEFSNLKQSLGMFTKGYKTGAKEQVESTRNIQKWLTNALVKHGIKRKELGVFDSVRRKIVTIQDAIRAQKDIEKKISQVFEARNKEVALKNTERLKKLARPLKGGKTPRGKMTAEAQKKLDRLFAFAEKSSLEAGLDEVNLVERFAENVEAELTTNETANLIKLQNQQTIDANNQELSVLRDKKITIKQKWEGTNEERTDLIKNTEDSVSANIKELKIQDSIKSEETMEIRKNIMTFVSKSLNLINMGLQFGDLNIEVQESALLSEEAKIGDSRGEYNTDTKTITISKDGQYSIVHEIGHYFDNILGEFISGQSPKEFSTYRVSPNIKYQAITRKLDLLIKSEAARTKLHPAFKNLNKEQKDYITSNSEIFARVFNALYNRVNKTETKGTDLISQLTNNMSTETINSFKSVLNDIADYKTNGMRIFSLEKENAELEKQNDEINKDAEMALDYAKMQQLPETVQELVQELRLASDLKNKTASEITEFNNYVERIITEGRDAFKEKKELQKQKREEVIIRLTDNIKKLTPKDSAVGKIQKKSLEIYNMLFANWDSYLNVFFGKGIAEEFSLTNENINREIFTYTSKDKVHTEAKRIYGAKYMWQLKDILFKKLKTEEVYLENVKERETIPVKLNTLNIMQYYIWAKNEVGRARLEYMYGEDQIRSMFSKLEIQDIEFADFLQKTAEEFYDIINPIFRDNNGIDLPRLKKYFPLLSENKTFDIDMLASAFILGGRTPSFTKTRVVSEKVALQKANPITTLFEYIDQIGDYIYLGDKINDIQHTFNDPRVIKNISSRYGESFLRDFKVKLNDITNRSRGERRNIITKILDRLVSNSMAAKIAVKPTLVLKQWLSFINYAENTPIKDFIKYQKEFISNPKKAIDFMMQDLYLQARFAGGTSSIELAKAMEDSSYSKTQNLLDFMLLNVRVGDIGGIAMGGYSRVKYLMNEKKLSKEEAFAIFRKETAESQPTSYIDSVSNIQAWGKKDPFARFVFAFKNTQNQFIRKIGDATVQVARGEITKSQYSKKLAIYAILNPWLYNMATSLSVLHLLLGFSDKDDEEKEKGITGIFEDLVGGAVYGNMDAVPILGDVGADLFHKIFTGEEYPSDSIMFTKEFRKAGYHTVDIVSALVSGDAEIEDLKLDEYLSEWGDMLSIFTAIPFKAFENIGTGIADIATGEPLPGTLKALGYSKKKAKEFATEE